MKKQVAAAAASIIGGIGLIAFGLITNDADSVTAGAAMIPLGGVFVVGIIRNLLAKVKLLESAVEELAPPLPPKVTSIEDALAKRNGE